MIESKYNILKCSLLLSRYRAALKCTDVVLLQLQLLKIIATCPEYSMWTRRLTIAELLNAMPKKNSFYHVEILAGCFAVV